MSYTIGKIIYGVAFNFDDELGKAVTEEYKDADAEADGFEHLYEGVHDMWFGVELGEIDECSDVNLYHVLENMRPTGEASDEWDHKFKKLPEKVRTALLSQFGPVPSWTIVWRSS